MATTTMTERKRWIDETIEYFRSRQWKEIVQIVQERDMNHMHVYVDTYLDLYDTLRPLITGYFRRRGWEVYRDIQPMADKHGAALYGIALEDKINFEIYCRLMPETTLAPMPAALGERGANLCVWTDQDIRRFQEQFEWRDVSPAEEAEVAAFFRKGKHWQRALDHVVDPDLMHVHCCVETSVHPDILRHHAMADLAARGWSIKHAIHSVFDGGGRDSGKIIFLGLKPERTFDIAYYYNPNTLIQVNTQDTGQWSGGDGSGNEYYLVRVSTLERELAKHQLRRLTGDEIEQILNATAAFDARSAYSWRIVPV